MPKMVIIGIVDFHFTHRHQRPAYLGCALLEATPRHWRIPPRTMERPPGYKRGGPLPASVYNCLPPIYTTFQNGNRCIYKTGDPLCKTRSIFLRKISRRVAPRKVFLIETILLTYSLAQIRVEIMLVFQQLLAKRVCTLTAIKGLFFALSLQSQIFTFTREGVCERRIQGNNSPEHRASI